MLRGCTRRLGLRGEGLRHRRLGRITLGAWLYGSVTGVVVCFLLRPYDPGD